MAVSLERPVGYKQNNNQEGKAPDWRRPIAEPREEAQKAREQNQGGSNRQRQNDNRGNKQNKGGGNDNNRNNNQGGKRKTPEEYRQEKLDRIDNNPINSRVIVQNTGETKALTNIAINLDRKINSIRQNMFNRLPGEYGALALGDAVAEISKLAAFEKRLNILGVQEYDGVKFNPNDLRKYHLATLQAFLGEADKLKEKLKAIGYEGEVIAQGLKEFLDGLKAKEEEARKAKEEAKAQREAEERAAREAKEALKAQRRADYEARQTAKEASASDNNEQPQQDVSSLTASSNDNEKVDEKPTKIKKEKATA